mmetsp:Transcript_6066/g.21413  ORF Transcript_6066/g.21413 Transcript_6066/m.21413 type:complete len:399 (-) Transcript_6066:368-1564(-)
MSRQQAKRMQEERELRQNCTFKPNISKTSRLLDKNDRPLHERVWQLQRDRQQRLMQAKVKEELSNPDLTFKPIINEKSQKIAKDRAGEGKNVAERLHEQSEISLYRKLTKVAMIESERAKDESFQPRINPNSDKILEQSEKFAGKDFFDRQNEYQFKKLKLSSENLNEFSFAPDIRSAEALLPPERRSESYLDRLERLAYRDKDQIQTVRDSIKEQYYSQFSFKPQLNEVSKQLGQAHSIQELYEDTERKEKMQRLIRAKEEELEQECTFRPQTYRPPKGLENESSQQSLNCLQPQVSYEKSRYSIDVRDTETLIERMKEKQRSKIEQAAQERRRKEYEELKECTFTPQILRQTPRPSSAPVLVRGLGRHLELRELAQRQVKRRRRKSLCVWGVELQV